MASVSVGLNLALVVYYVICFVLIIHVACGVPYIIDVFPTNLFCSGPNVTIPTTFICELRKLISCRLCITHNSSLLFASSVHVHVGFEVLNTIALFHFSPVFQSFAPPLCENQKTCTTVLLIQYE